MKRIFSLLLALCLIGSIMIGTGGYYLTDYDEELDQWFTWWHYYVPLYHQR